MQSVVFDCQISHLLIYDYGNLSQQGSISSRDVADWCIRNLKEGTSIFLIGSKSETDSIYQKLKKYRLNICCYDPKQADPNRNTNNSQFSLEGVLSSLDEIKALLKREQPKSSNYALINTSSSQRESKDMKELKSLILESFETLNKKQSEMNYLVNEIYNHDQETSSDGYSEILTDLRNELAAYKNDFYQKSMLKFGVNTTIEILERLYNEKNLLMQKENLEEFDRITQIISFCESKMKKLNLRISHSIEGDEFDGERMIYFDDKVATDDENMKGRVAYSIFPAIYWTLPRVNAPGEDELLIKEETVALYE